MEEQEEASSSSVGRTRGFRRRVCSDDGPASRTRRTVAGPSASHRPCCVCLVRAHLPSVPGVFTDERRPLNRESAASKPFPPASAPAAQRPRP